MVAKVTSLGFLGVDGFLLKVEADISSGLPGFDIVGLPDASVKESRDRVRSAIKNCGFSFPSGKITINLAPADIKKEGPIYDLPILVALLVASGQIEGTLEGCAFLGELSLEGELRPIKGVLPMAITARDAGLKRVYIPAQNAAEGQVVEGLEVVPVDSVSRLARHLRGEKVNFKVVAKNSPSKKMAQILDFSQVKGQNTAKRALEIAAAGGHNILMIGPPGSGKSMLSKRVPGILPDMTREESIETTKLYSIAGLLPSGVSLVCKRPFRSPHHTISAAGLCGGGSVPRPGEISLAHNGVIFLDELPEFARVTLEVLRQPLEQDLVTIARVSGTVSYPCSVMLVAAMNPCQCGYLGHPTRKCTCSQHALGRYMARISGPLLDRIDLHIDVPAVKYDEISSKEDGESSKDIKLRVDKARVIQNERYRGMPFSCNSKIGAEILQKVCPISHNADALLKKTFEALDLSARAYDKILKVSRTIADLAGSEVIKTSHLAEAVQYRNLDRKYRLSGGANLA